MLDLTQAEMPAAVMAGGIFYAIHTDFRFYIKLHYIIKEKGEKLTLGDLNFLFNTPDRPETEEAWQEAVKEIINFYKPKRELPRPVSGSSSSGPILDYKLDADLIYSAFMQQYGIDLFSKDEKGNPIKIHWWKFQALLDGLKNTKLNDVEGFRSYDENDKGDTKAFYRQQKRAWEILEPLTEEEQKELDKFDSLWK